MPRRGLSLHWGASLPSRGLLTRGKPFRAHGTAPRVGTLREARAFWRLREHRTLAVRSPQTPGGERPWSALVRGRGPGSVQQPLPKEAQPRCRASVSRAEGHGAFFSWGDGGGGEPGNSKEETDRTFPGRTAPSGFPHSRGPLGWGLQRPGGLARRPRRSEAAGCLTRGRTGLGVSPGARSTRPEAAPLEQRAPLHTHSLPFSRQPGRFDDQMGEP